MIDETTPDEMFSYLTMIKKALKWALKSGVAIGALGTFGLHIENLVEVVLASSVLIGLLTGLTNTLKHKYKITWLP